VSRINFVIRTGCAISLPNPSPWLDKIKPRAWERLSDFMIRLATNKTKVAKLRPENE